jgi:hypothetical protein
MKKAQQKAKYERGQVITIEGNQYTVINPEGGIVTLVDDNGKIDHCYYSSGKLLK